MRQLLNKTIRYYKNNGFVRTIKKILCSLKFSLFIYRKIVMCHKQITISDFALVDNLNISAASSKDIDEEYQDIWHTREEALEELRKGHILFLEKEGSANTLYVWIHLLSVDIPWLCIKNLAIPVNIAYLATVYVPSQYRGKDILRSALKFIEKYLLNNAMTDRIFVVTAPDNVASSKIFESSGYIPYQQVRYLKIMGIKLYIVESLENRQPKCKKMFIQSTNFWNVFSPILKGS